jgi:hypothetical protein
MATLVAFRASNWDSPFRPGPARLSYRFSDEAADATQYWCLHPLGPLAETLRWRNIRSAAFVAELRVRLWAARFDDSGLVRVGFAEAAEHGLEAGDLVSDDYGAGQAWAAAVRRTVPGMIVPSAALPGSENLVLFGPRVRIPYGGAPFDAGLEVPADPVADGGKPPVDLLRHVRWRGDPHAGLEAWRDGDVLAAAQVRVEQAGWRDEA